ncbi:MAG: BspA family leucine-rich repeat surface protein [Polaribacter sp.]
MKLNNETIREAVKLWLEDEAAATKKYGFINDWDTSEVTDTSKLFCSHNFNSPIGNWDVSNVKTMHAMFENAFKFNQNINNWDVSDVEDMSDMFSSTFPGWEVDFNQPIGDWDVSNVTNMSNMFSNAKSFNQPIGNWDVSNVETMQVMFSLAESFNQPIGNWDVSNVTNMSSMFKIAESFNQPIGKWDVSNVTDLSFMFSLAKSFNQPIGDWDVSNVKDMRSMFCNAKSFFQHIGDWVISHKTDCNNMFYGAKSFAYDELKVKDFLTENTHIKIVDDFSLKKSGYKFKLIDYKWNGGNDFNYNIFNNEPLPNEEYIGSPSSSVFTISVNDTNLYIKYFEIYDGPFEGGSYVGISETKDFKNTEWYDAVNRKKGELINCISILSHVFTNEDIWSYEEFLQDFEKLASYTKEYEIFSFDKVEFNVEVDLKKLQKYDGFH